MKDALSCASSGKDAALEASVLGMYENLLEKVVTLEAAVAHEKRRANKARRETRKIANALLHSQNLPPARAFARAGALEVGFSKTRTLRHHVQAFHKQLEEKYPKNFVKQLQIVAALLQRFGSKSRDAKRTARSSVASSVLSSITQFYSELKKKHKGRYSTESRMALQAVSTAIIVKPTVSLERISAAVGVKKCHLTRAWKRWTAYVNGDEEHLLELKAATRRDKYPEEWVTFVQNAWTDSEISRVAESTKDAIRHPNDKSDKILYNKYILEVSNTEAHQIILRKG